MDYSTASWAKCETVFARFILKYLQDCGGQAERSVIREALLDEDEDIAKFAEFVKIAKKTGAEYRPFAYKFNFTIKDLLIAGYISYTRAKPLITLTQKGANFNVDEFDYERDMNSITKKYWNEQHKAAAARKNKTTNATSSEDEEEAGVDKADEYEEEFKNKLLAAIGNMSPKKFELFSRALLSKMGVEFTSVGTQISNDGGIDGTIKEEDLNEYIEQCTQYLITHGLFRVTDYIGTSDKNKVAAQLIMNCVSTISSLMYCAAKHEDTDTETGGEPDPNVPDDDDVVPDNSVVHRIMPINE